MIEFYIGFGLGVRLRVCFELIWWFDVDFRVRFHGWHFCDLNWFLVIGTQFSLNLLWDSVPFHHYGWLYFVFVGFLCNWKVLKYHWNMDLCMDGNHFVLCWIDVLFGQLNDPLIWFKVVLWYVYCFTIFLWDSLAFGKFYNFIETRIFVWMKTICALLDRWPVWAVEWSPNLVLRCLMICLLFCSIIYVQRNKLGILFLSCDPSLFVWLYNSNGT